MCETFGICCHTRDTQEVGGYSYVHLYSSPSLSLSIYIYACGRYKNNIYIYIYILHIHTDLGNHWPIVGLWADHGLILGPSWAHRGGQPWGPFMGASTQAHRGPNMCPVWAQCCVSMAIAFP
jgi:hypothetical protein